MMKTLTEAEQEKMKVAFETAQEAFVEAQSNHQAMIQQVFEMQQRLEHQDKLLQRKSRLEALGNMAAGVAHEIRNPLGGICLYTDLLIRRLKGSELEWERSKAMKIRENIMALEQIVSDMLNFTHESEPKMKEEDLSNIISQSVELAKGHNSFNSHHVDLSVAPATLCVDRRQLQQVFLNIILNAFQAMEERGELVVRGRFLDNRQSYVVTFCDTGTGIPEDKLEDIFNPFVTFKDGGTGLGLAIGHRVIEQHGGRLEVVNNRRCGVTFMITLPINSGDESPELDGQTE
jgi:two-component system NtrC family sensor kinase